MLADEAGRFVSQREGPALARVSVIFGTNDDAVTISSHGLPRWVGDPVDILEAA